MTVMLGEMPRVADPYQREALLTAEQERVYIARIQAGYDRDAQEHLVRANIGWIATIAKKFYHQGVEMDDLVQEGCLALLKAAQQFDLSSNFRLTTLATWKIRQVLQRCIENTGMTIRLPAHRHELMRRLKHDPDAASATYSADQIAEVRRAMHVRSLEVPLLTESGELALIDVVSEDDATEECALQAVQKEELHAVMNDVLTERERRLLSLRFGLMNDQEHTRQETGELMRLSHERVRQIEYGALAKVRQSPWVQTMVGKKAR